MPTQELSIDWLELEIELKQECNAGNQISFSHRIGATTSELKQECNAAN